MHVDALVGSGDCAMQITDSVHGDDCDVCLRGNRSSYCSKVTFRTLIFSR